MSNMDDSYVCVAEEDENGFDKFICGEDESHVIVKDGDSWFASSRGFLQEDGGKAYYARIQSDTDCPPTRTRVKFRYPKILCY